MTHRASDPRQNLLPFFGLVAALSAPFWILGALLPLQILPGVPISAAMAFMPAIAAGLLLLRDQKKGAEAPAWRLRWPSRGILLLSVLIPVAANGLAMAIHGRPPLDPGATLGQALFLFGLLTAAAVGEEAGWTGYALPRLRARIGPVAASLLLGFVWWAWHLIPFLQAGQDGSWIAWKAVSMTAARLLIGWLWETGRRSVVVAVAFHAFDNLSLYLTPGSGAHFDPRLTGFLLVAALAAVILPMALRRRR